MKLFIVRHGQDIDNRDNILNGHRDTDLTDLGKSQAKQAGEKLKNKKIDCILASPLKRTFETAKIIANEIGTEKLITHKKLVERDFGILTGKPKSEIPKYSDNILKTDAVSYFIDAEYAENFLGVYQRARELLDELDGVFDSQNLILVTHEDMAKMLRAVYQNQTWQDALKTPYVDNADILEL